MTNSPVATPKLALGEMELADIVDFQKLFDEECYEYTYRVTLGRGLTFGEMGIIFK